MRDDGTSPNGQRSRDKRFPGGGLEHRQRSKRQSGLYADALGRTALDSWALLTPMEAACAAENNPHWLSANRARAVRVSCSMTPSQQHDSDRTSVRLREGANHEAQER